MARWAKTIARSTIVGWHILCAQGTARKHCSCFVTLLEPEGPGIARCCNSDNNYEHCCRCFIRWRTRRNYFGTCSWLWSLGQAMSTRYDNCSLSLNKGEDQGKQKRNPKEQARRAAYETRNKRNKASKGGDTTGKDRQRANDRRQEGHKT